ncbi:PDZ domain-containing protein [Azospirillum brasilense]|uniref:PDZ domain-containing protein n=1 Tax=Azospirillum brasilense TaxID=192 RepID=UPI001EDC091F|nr:PDZ domain-containing protein [Azospirillum brasilense]UKJ72025.1 PDZ domain-containing protein [Azospirillum brasilense]
MQRVCKAARAWMAALVAVSGAATVSGCALDPVGLAVGAASSVSGSEASMTADVASAYRGTDCPTLEALLKAYNDPLPTLSGSERQAQMIHITAVRQLMAEQRCPAAGSAAAAGAGSASAPTGTAGPGTAGPAAAPAAAREPQGAMGAAVSPLTAQLAQTVGLEVPRGLLVTALMPGKAAELSGIRGGDVILEVRGVAVDDAVQMRRVLGAVPSGQSVLVKLWRARELRELIVGPITSTTPALPPGAAYADAPVLPAAPVRERFCVAQAIGSGLFASGLHSPLFTVRNDGSEAESAKLATAFLEAARKAQPGYWLAPHPRPTCTRDSKVCTSASADSDVLMILCETDRETGAEIYESLRRDKPLTELPWSPSAP